jgi:hypothetical protein
MALQPSLVSHASHQHILPSPGLDPQVCRASMEKRHLPSASFIICPQILLEADLALDLRILTQLGFCCKPRFPLLLLVLLYLGFLPAVLTTSMPKPFIFFLCVWLENCIIFLYNHNDQ